MGVRSFHKVKVKICSSPFPKDKILISPISKFVIFNSSGEIYYKLIKRGILYVTSII